MTILAIVVIFYYHKMALRAFQCNPSLGGFGGESSPNDQLFGHQFHVTASGSNTHNTTHGGHRPSFPMPSNDHDDYNVDNADNTEKAHAVNAANADEYLLKATPQRNNVVANDRYHFDAGCCDAFAQIVKELVDNAVDACAVADSNLDYYGSSDGLSRNERSNEHPCSKRPVLTENENGGDINANANMDNKETKKFKRVRVIIVPETHPLKHSKHNGNGTDGPTIVTTTTDTDHSARCKYMECYRISVSDNGCGMENIDDCVTVFRSNKNGSRKLSSSGIGGGNGDGGDSQTCPVSGEATQKHKTIREKWKKKITEKQTSAMQGRSCSSSDDAYTAGRYGVGLTLCLLHAQRLVPYSHTTIISSTVNDDEWVRATFRVNTEDDEVQCTKRETIPKTMGRMESGTCISLLVPVSIKYLYYYLCTMLCLREKNIQMKPTSNRAKMHCTYILSMQAGKAVQHAWPRLREYLTRFQLSTELPCSLEVVAPTLMNIPLYIRPPWEIEKRFRDKKLNKNMMMLPALDFVMKEREDKEHCGSENSNPEDDDCHKEDGEEDWDDGFDDENKVSSDKENYAASQESMVHPNRRPPLSKGAQERARTNDEKDKKIALIVRAARKYKRRQVKIKNVAHTTEPIRRNSAVSGGLSSTSKSLGPVLELSMIVFGPESNNNNDDPCCDGIVHRRNYAESQDGDDGRNYHANSATISVVRMVNGIPLLDSPEALACGVVQKITNIATTWNSFGLDVSLRKKGDVESEDFSQQDTPTLDVHDSAQVAPFFQSSAHSLFQDQSRNYYDDPSSCDEGDFDHETIKRKRKKERDIKSLLPASLRLGDVLMIVQIRAKPSALPLPTLSKVSLQLVIVQFI